MVCACFFFLGRAFVEKNYQDLKALNPKFPILIRECRGIEPQLWARYGISFTPPCLLIFAMSCEVLIFPNVCVLKQKILKL